MSRTKFLLATALASLVIAGCGGAGDSPQPGDSSATAANDRAALLAVGATQVSAAAVARLTTPWTTAALQAPVPLPEYPRPQMTRPDWLNLNGTWNYLGGGGAPNADNPPAAAPGFPANAEQIRVPYPVESYLSGIQRMNERNLWYKRSFTVPAGWNGRRVRLNFGAVDRKATVYVNGQRVGQHIGGYAGFSFDITPFLRTGSNDLVVGAFDPTDGTDMVGKQTLSPGGIFYTPTSGIWQTVWLEPVAAQNITRLDMVPDLGNNTLRVTVRGEGIPANQLISVSVFDGAALVGNGSGQVNQEFRIPIPNPHLWSPNDPFLYDVKAAIIQGSQAIDQVGSYIGMRSIAVGTVGGVPRPLLNGKFVFQFGPLDQGFWPDGLYTAPTDEALKSDLQAEKDLGFNMVRKHIKVEPQRWFYWADKLGIMVWQDMPQAWQADSQPDGNNPRNDPAAQARYMAGAREIVDQHLSSPAIVTWVIFNESWGDFDHPGRANLFRSWDSSRLINAHSGINFAPGDTGAGDLIDNHDYPGPSAPAYKTNRPSVLGEFGGNGLKTPGHEWNPASTCCYTTYPDSASLTNAVIGQINSLRDLAVAKGLSAAVYTEISDVEDELNGFLTYDRQVKKMDFARVKAASQALVNGVPFIRLGSSYSLRTVTPGVTDRYLRHVNSLGVTEVVNAGSAELLKKDTSWKAVSGLADNACLSFESINLPGQFLRHASSRLRIDANDNSTLFAQDATFCARAALDGNGGISLESKNFPGRFIRHRNSEVWLDTNDNGQSFKADASWAAESGWWRSSVLIPAGQFHSLRVLTPNFDTRYVRHLNGLAYTEVVDANSAPTLKQDATWKIVTGLADASCYSFESRNFAGEYLRHSNSRVSRAAPDNTSLFREDATFCAQSSASGPGARFAAYNFPQRFLRHYAAELWIADGQGGIASNTSAGFDADSRWSVDNPWAP
jgi:Alpha-L-arabinofuranosidase B (ABFB) domain/Glycosyl hydrolases family 2, sugar binding domain/Glycosyl hydrolases family 2/Glycosyl hydrolases family 2, TIM barrel domain